MRANDGVPPFGAKFAGGVAMGNAQSAMFLYFSRILSKSVIAGDNKPVGVLSDVFVHPNAIYPDIASIIVRKGGLRRRYAMVPWPSVARLDSDEIVLSIPSPELDFTRETFDSGDLALRRDILDQQVVDIDNHRVIRVNDIHLLSVGSNWLTAHVDIGGRAIVRRLGFEKVIDTVVRLFRPRSKYLTTEHLIPWKHMHPLALSPGGRTIKVDAGRKELVRMHAADLTDIFVDIPLQSQIAFFKSLDLSNRAKIFMNLDFKTQNSMAEELDDAELTALVELLPADEGADFLEGFPKERRERLLAILGGTTSKRLSRLLGYESDSAGGLMSTEFLAVPPGALVSEVIETVRAQKQRTEHATIVCIVDGENRLMNTLGFRDLLLARLTDPAAAASSAKPFFVRVDSGLEEVAYLMEKYKISVIPVVDETDVLQGVITVDDILEQLIALAWRRKR